MKIKVDDLPAIIAAWADKNLIPKSNPLQIVLITFAIAQFKDKIISYAKFTADSDGNVDLDQLIENAKTALKKAGGRVNIPLLNYNFDLQDISDLYDVAKNFGS